MSERADRLVHLSGYATLALVLATADWASPVFALFALPLLVGTVAYAGWHLYAAQRDTDSESAGDATEVPQEYPVGSDP